MTQSSKFSRRDALKTGVLTAAATACVATKLPLTHVVGNTATTMAATTAQAADPFRGLKIGVASYSLRKMNLDDAIKATQRLGLRYIALKDFHLPLTSTADGRREAAGKIKDAKLELLGCGVISMKPDEAQIRNAFEYAKDAGIQTIIASPDPAALPIISRFVKEYGIRVAIHNHGPEDKKFPTPDSVAAALKGHDERIGLCIDIGHTERAGVNAAEAIRKHAARLYDLHFKDIDKAVADGKTVEVGRGVIDIPAVLRALRAIKYQNHVALEYEKDADDPVPGMAESVGYTRGVLAAVQVGS